MKRILSILVLASAFLTTALAAIPVVPYPLSVREQSGKAFNAKGAAVRCDDSLDALSQQWIGQFADALRKASGTDETSKCVIRFSRNPAIADEAYDIQVCSKGILVSASGPAGFFYAIETLKQLLPVEIYTGKAAPKDANWAVGPVRIQDRPRFGYRGMHLDCARHFFTLDEIKRYIDIIAMFKVNRFHWHLTDDQGWRVEIKKYPRLTEVGAWRDGTCILKDWDSSDGIRYGGWYTQDQLREIVAYAAERNITVIPELDLPGHMLAALSSYPELGCTGGPYKVWQRWGVTNEILCAGNEQVYTFLEDVLTELCDIFPSEYIHIGGDECFTSDTDDPWDLCPKCIAKMEELGIERGPKEKHFLQNYVTARIQSFLQTKGRKIIGWDEILEGDLAPGATIMSWRGVGGGIKAANQGFDAIMTPVDFLYFDFYQGDERDKEPFGIGGRLPIERVYGYEPLEGITPGAEKHILGVQANLWTEYIATPEHLEYMLLPRLCALSELQWTAPEHKDWDRFNASLDHLFAIFEARGYTYCRDVRGEIGLDRIPARSRSEMKQYMQTKTWNW